MADSLDVKLRKQEWVAIPDITGFLLQNKSNYLSIFVAVAAVVPTVSPELVPGVFEVLPKASMGRLDGAGGVAHWGWVWDNIEPAAFVAVT